MIHVQFFGWKVLPAILALEFVALQKILAIEFHFLHKHSVVSPQNKNTGNEYPLVDRMDHPRSGNGLELLAVSKPRRTVEHPKAAVCGIDHLSMIHAKQTKRPFYTHYIDRLPKSV